MSPPAARLLDLTRLAGRAARVLTGVDRVERAWAEWLAADAAVPLFALVRTRPGYLLLDRAGVLAFLQAIDKQAWGAARRFDRMTRRDDPDRARVEGTLRRHAIARAPHRWLASMLRRRLPALAPDAPLSYVNVGQTTLHGDTVAALRRLPGARVTVMVHDTIPLDHPEWQRPGTAARFAARLRLAAGADRVLVTSGAVAADVARHLGADAPPVTVAPLGVTLAAPDPAAVPGGLPDGPWFVTLNTIEARKNHALLLDVWDDLGPGAPLLCILGARGWENDAVLARLDARPPRVREMAGLSDGAVAALVAGARAMLNPSLAEGYGLPALEAAGRGVPLVCTDLPVWHELLGDYPVYAAPDDRYLWAGTVRSLAAGGARKPPLSLPTWEGHFTALSGLI
ncbi:MAG: glycosyltransferase [Rubellimicrobium sp.]|nr:glycosyltransferase [Rubellimicrobium sp.]